MDYQIEVKQVAPQLTAVVRRRASQAQLSTVVPQGCGEVWTYMRSSGQPRPGRHVALYLNGNIDLEVGVEAVQPFTGNDQVVCSSLPRGLVATTIHMGPYARLCDAHHAVRNWCAANAHALAGPCWEIYGHWEKHWDNDPAQVRTDLFYLLQPKGTAAT